jgi:hypothetical protein
MELWLKSYGVLKF